MSKPSGIISNRKVEALHPATLKGRGFTAGQGKKLTEIVDDFFNKKHVPDVRYGFPDIVIPEKKEIEKLTCENNNSLFEFRVIETFGCRHHSDYDHLD